jgi:hypothetical protein
VSAFVETKGAYGPLGCGEPVEVHVVAGLILFIVSEVTKEKTIYLL